MALNLDELWNELERGRVYECSLRDPNWHLDGLQTGDSVYIDQRSSMLEILLHELTHRRYPKMGERSVTREARRLFAGMGDTEKSRWWRRYKRIRKIGRPVEAE